MPSQNFDATGTPQDIAAALSLTVGTRYTAQNLSTTATLLVREAATVPDAGDRAFRVEASGHFTIKPDPAVGVYLWTDNGACPVLVDEAA